MIEAYAAKLLLRSVAAGAALLENRAHFARKIDSGTASRRKYQRYEKETH